MSADTTTSADLQSSIKQVLEKGTLTTRYQKILILFCCFCQVLGCFVYMIGSFVFMNPIFECQGTPTPEQEACAKIDKCTITNQFTATFYSQLYCEKQFIRSSIQAVLFVGQILGILIFASVSDNKGRKYALLLSFAIQIVGVSFIIIGIYQKIAVLCIVGQILVGFFMANSSVCCYIMISQHCSDSMRQHALILLCATWGLSEMSFFLFYNYIPWWDYYLILALLIPSIGGFAITYFLLIQSPYFYLYMAKNYEMFVDSLQSLQFYNKYDEGLLVQVKSMAHRFNDLQYLNQDRDQSIVRSIKQLWSSKKHLIYCICLIGLGTGFSVYYYGMQLTMERTGYDFGTSMLLAGGYQFLGYLSAHFFIQKIPRKKGLFVLILLSAGLGLGFLLPFVKNNQLLQSIGQSLIRVLSTYNYSLFALLQTQSFPLQLLTIGIGIADGGSELGNIGVPYLVDQFNNTSIHPAAAAAMLYLVLSLLALLGIKETLKKKHKDQQVKTNNRSNDTVDTTDLSFHQQTQINNEPLLTQ